MIQPSSNEESPSEATPLVRATESSTSTRTDDNDPETGREEGSNTDNNTNTNGHGGHGGSYNGIVESPLFENDFDHFVDTITTTTADEDELDKPWPATFERSISLLAGPIRDTHLIEEITKSPKIITPNIRDRRRVR